MSIYDDPAYNHFIEFSEEELLDAYDYFHLIHDYEGCRLVGDAFSHKVIIDLKGFGI